MVARVTLKLSAETRAVEQWCEELFAELADVPLEVAQRFVQRLHALGESVFTVRLQPDIDPASGASDQRIVFEPSEPLRRLLAALRAGDFDRNVV